MTKEEKLLQLKQWEDKVNAYGMALTMIGLDANNNPPTDGGSYRNEKRAILAGEAFKLENDPSIYELLKDLEKEELDRDEKRIVELYVKEFEKTRSVPQEEFVEYQKCLGASEQAWLKYKLEDNYEGYEPYLKELIEKHKKLISYQNSPLSLYNRMLDDHQNGWNEEKYDAFFNKVKERIIPLIKEIVQAKQIDQSFLFKTYPAKAQREFMPEILSYIAFTPNWGKLGESEHPLTTSINKNDIRFTTKYRENNIAMAILSSIHEVGHAYYGHQVSDRYDGTIISHTINAGIHESQSRLCENHLGRSLPFWKVNYPKLQKAFPTQLEGVTTEDFYRAINASEPSLIRTDADELTYPLHIIIRYEIEKGLFNGSIPTENLNKVWNEKYEEYLGVKVPNDKDGILQDMHWPYAYFGYFPTYALGSAYAAQFYHKMKEEIDVDQLLLDSQYPVIMEWLKTHVHQYANRYSPDEVLEKATGETFQVNYYLDYLEEKYRRLYNL